MILYYVVNKEVERTTQGFYFVRVGKFFLEQEIKQLSNIASVDY